MCSIDRKYVLKHVGPGGMNCVCCGPAPGKERQQFLRSKKRAFRQVVKREIQLELAEQAAG